MTLDIYPGWPGPRQRAEGSGLRVSRCQRRDVQHLDPIPAAPAQPAPTLVSPGHALRSRAGCGPSARQLPPLLAGSRPSGAAQPAGVTIAPRELQGDAVVPASVLPVRGLAAGHDPRYQCAPGERIAGGFAEMGIGRYLEKAAQ